MIRKNNFLVVVFLFFLSPVYGYTLFSEKASVHNDTIFLFKKVDFVSENYSVKTDSLFVLKDDSTVYFPKDFKLNNEDSLIVSAKKGIFLSKDKKFKIYFQKTEKENNFILSSDTLEIFTKDSLFVYSGNPFIDEKKENMFVWGNIVRYYFNLERTELEGKSFLQKKDSSYYLLSDRMILNYEDSLNIFSGNVEIYNDSFKIKTDSAIFNKRGSFFITLNRTDIVANNNFFEGDNFIFYFENDTIKEFKGNGNISFTRSDQNEIKILCDSIEGYFENSRVKILNFYKIKKSQLVRVKKNEVEK